MDEITDLICQLGRRIRLEPIDLRYISKRWCVLVPVGDRMRAVPGCSGRTPEAALRVAIARWDGRSERYPFI